VPGQVNKGFAITNIDSFPEYDFYYLFVPYTYNRGYVAGTPDTIAIAQGQTYQGGSRPTQVLIYASSKDGKGKTRVSELMLSGMGESANPDAQSWTEYYRVDRVTRKKVVLELVRDEVYPPSKDNGLNQPEGAKNPTQRGMVGGESLWFSLLGLLLVGAGLLGRARLRNPASQS